MTISQEYYLTCKLNSNYHKVAIDFASQQDTTEKGKKVYLNTLAVCAVKDFIEELSFETILDKSYSWNPIIRCFEDVADIVVSELGRVECLAITEDTDLISIPKEVREGRIAYIVVRFPEILTEVELLGFYRCRDRIINSETIQISELEPIEDLIDYLFDLELAGELELDRELIETGTSFLVSNDEVAIRVRQRLNSESNEEIIRQFINIYHDVEEEERRFEGAKILKNLMGIEEADLVAIDRSSSVEEEDILTFELEDLAEDLLDKLGEIWSDDESNIDRPSSSDSATTLPQWSIIDRFQSNFSQITGQVQAGIDELAEQVGWLLSDFQLSMEGTRAIRAKDIDEGQPEKRKIDDEIFKQKYLKLPLTIAGQNYELRIMPKDISINEWRFELRNAASGGKIPPGFKLRLLDENGEAFEDNEMEASTVVDTIYMELEFESGEGVIWEIEPTPNNYQREIIYF